MSKGLIYGIALFLFAIIPLFDFINVYGAGGRYSIFIRAVFLFVVLLGALKTKENIQIIFTAILAILFGTFISFFNLLTGTISEVEFSENIIFLIKIFSLPIYCCFFSSLSLHRKMKVYKVSMVVIFCYVSAVIIGAVFSIEYLSNYGETERFGFKGIISAGNETASFFLIALFWACTVHLKKQSLISLFFLCLVIVGSLMTGTKSAILMNVILLTAIAYKRFGLKAFVFHAPAFLSVFFISIYIFYLNLSPLALLVDGSIAYFKFQLSNSASGNWLTLLLSGRDYKLEQVWSGFIAQHPQSLILGGYPFGRYSVEMDFFDLIFTAGGVLTSIYCVLVFEVLRKNQFLKKGPNRPINVSFLLAIFVVSFFGGHFLYSGVGVIFLALFFTVLNRNEC
ncbi:O-antigen ligase family protein [Psychrosphaera haliotis]|uniref:O-antigen ligase family protein n=1 Tax=Psychrosphaera haliotis TaxID=555083 RepID=UPI00236C6A68|nr:O-antigen ligase family protein [Psychrosphaera haliotis]